jgi:O-antigen ligase
VTALLWRRGGPAVGWPTAVLVLCAIVGVVAGVNPKYGLLAPVALGFVVIVFTNLVLGIAIFAALSFLDVLAVGGAAVSFDKVAGLLLFVSWALRQATARRTRGENILGRHPAMWVWIVTLLSWTAISILWATQRGQAIETAYRDGLLLLLTPIVYTAVRNRRDLHLIIYGYLVGAGFSAIFGMLNPPAATAAAGGRLVGSLGEANQSATVLVAAIALAFGLGYTARRSPRVRFLAIVAGGLSVIGLLQTLSRAGLIAFAFVLVAGVIFGGRWRRIAVVLLVLGVVGLPVYFFSIAPPHALERVTSGDTSGRNDIWRVAWRAFESNPVLGVGGGNFEFVSARYLQRPGLIVSANDFLISPKVAHNIYLEQLVDLGVLGLIALLGIFGCGIAAALRAAHIFERLGDAELELLSRCCILAFCAFLSADFFASELISKQLWLIFALFPALLKLAELERQGIAT